MNRSMTGLGVAALIGALSSPVAATELVVNGGFESGLAGWTKLGPVTATAISDGVTPNSGASMAVLGGLTDPSGDALLAQTAQLDTSVIHSVNVSFAYNLQAIDITELVDSGVDLLAVGVLPAGSLATGFAAFSNATILLTVPFNDAYSGASSILGWNTFSQTITGIPDMGSVDFILGFGLQNTSNLGLNGDAGQLTAAYIDDVSVTTIPEPAVALLLWGGLLVPGLRWRHARGG